MALDGTKSDWMSSTDAPAGAPPNAEELRGIDLLGRHDVRDGAIEGAAGGSGLDATDGAVVDAGGSAVAAMCVYSRGRHRRAFTPHWELPVTHPSDAAPASDTPAPAKPAPVWEDFLDIFISPAEVFARRRHAGFVIPLIVLTLLIAGIAYGVRPVLQPMLDAEWMRQVPAMMRANPKLTPEQLESMRRTSQTLMPVILLLGVPISIFIIGVVLWGVGKFVDATERVGAAIMIATYAYFPRVLEQVVYGIQGLLMSPASLDSRYAVGLNLARFMSLDSSPIALALASRVDVFLIWVTVLLGIGLAVVGRIPRGRAFAAAAIVWLLGALPAVLGALRTPR